MSSQNRRIPFLSELYRQYLDVQDSAGFISKVSQCYAPGTLQRLACHRSREVRRAAVLALGFLGDYTANHTKHLKSIAAINGILAGDTLIT